MLDLVRMIAASSLEPRAPCSIDAICQVLQQGRNLLSCILRVQHVSANQLLQSIQISASYSTALDTGSASAVEAKHALWQCSHTEY